MILIDCTNYDECERREWLVTNGIGGYASGTVPSTLTRNYHGYLVAALNPPLDRTVLVSKLDEMVTVDGKEYPLFVNRWKSHDEPPEPNGFEYLESFVLDGSVPTWTYRVAGIDIQKRVWMAYGENTSYVQYTASAPVSIGIKVMVNYKNFHDAMKTGDINVDVEHFTDGVAVTTEVFTFYLFSERAKVQIRSEWQTDYFLPVEKYRGEPELTDHFHAVTFTAELRPDEGVTFVFSTEAMPELDEIKVLAAVKNREKQLIEQSGMEQEPQWIQQLVLAADQFIVRRDVPGIENGRTIIAGYHWFSDWGRDTMIALPGLTLTTGRYVEAAAILRTFAKFVDRGMLPNRFPDDNEAPEYNTVDATLWYFEAIRAYYTMTGDRQLVNELFPIMEDIINWHIKGTRYHIKMDGRDGLLYAGQDDVQLTWMDVKIRDWVVTPRTGKAVEINALWYNAQCIMAEFAALLGAEDVYSEIAEKTKTSYSKFWNEETGYLFDVIEGPAGNDPSLRPNQIFAVSIGRDLLTSEQQKAVVDSCVEHLVTPYGLRSLAPLEPDYIGHYGGERKIRDAAYHQGTVWAWLAGHTAQAHNHVYQDIEQKLAFLKPFEAHLKEYGVGTISEIFDGDFPHTPRGTIAQAWSVAEVLRVWE
ncbi:MAG: amylo-alpha-1,6-glucosidase [Chloroflexi bacterium]|nr:amylo-alpha-1,6-glucosidase [Chloroflexota bacterium]